MQVFLTNSDFKISAMELDDLRLGACAKEIVQLLCGMENLDYHIKDKNIKIGHSNHPVFKHYYCMSGQCFLTEYLYYLCNEWYYRYGKQNQAYFTLRYFSLQYSFYSEGVEDEYGGVSDWEPAYIKGSGKNQIITTENIYELYKNLLIDKWNNDTPSPKWTNRNAPIWYQDYFNKLLE